MRTVLWLTFFAMAWPLAACGRDSARQGLAVVVVDEARVVDPYGPESIERRSAAGAKVYLYAEGHAPADLTDVSRALRACDTDLDGRCWFGGVEGLFDVGVDLNDDGVLDASALQVPSGSVRTLVVESLASLADAALTLTLDADAYGRGDKAAYRLKGFLPRKLPVTVEIWHEAGKRKLIKSLKAGTFGGDVTYSADFTVDRAWPETPPSKLADYLAIPKVRDSYYAGARFTLNATPDAGGGNGNGGGAAAITGMSVVIDAGAAVTRSRNVTLTVTATNATMMTFSDVVTQLTTAVRFPYMNSAGFSLAPGDGVKTVWVMFFDADGNYAGPVSDTIVLDELPPPPPDASRFVVWANPPGSDDYLVGQAGAAEADAWVQVWGNSALTELIAEGPAGPDGAFGPLDIGDNRVIKPQDVVYVTATDAALRRSDASPAYNDSTAPDLWPEHFTLTWIVDALGPGVGNPGDVARVTYTIPAGYEPATDVTGGRVDFTAFGGPPTAALSPEGFGQFSATFTIPAGINVDSDFIRFRVQVHDAAFNRSAWVYSAEYYSIDSIPPPKPTVTGVSGGNRELGARWADAASDVDTYEVTLTDETGAVRSYTVSKLEYLGIVFGLLTPPTHTFPGKYPFVNLANCHWYSVRVRGVDNGGNRSSYSNPVSDRVILPPPEFEAWAGLSGATGLIAYSMVFVENATGYELHFGLDSLPPYAYDNGSVTSPTSVSVAQDTIQLGYLINLPLRTTFYLAGRARDDAAGACVSDYSAEMTATTDLREAAHADGAEHDTFGGALAETRDYNADGVIDFIAGAPYPQYAGIVSGGNATPLAQFGDYRAPDSYDIPGLPVAAVNVDADPEDEFIVGAPLESPGGTFLAGRARLYDHDGTLLQTFTGDAEGLHLGFTIVRLGDLNAVPDGRDEFAVAGFGCAHRSCGVTPMLEPPTEGPGKVTVYDGATRTPLYPTLVGPSAGDYFGIAVTVVADIDLDGVRDLAVGAPGTDRSQPGPSIRFYSGRTGALLSATTPLAGSGLRAGAALARLTGVPGRPELLVVGAPGSGDTPGAVAAVDRFGSLVWRRSGLNVFGGAGFGAVLATGGDVNGDGVPDVVVGAPLGAQSLFYGPGAAFVLDGKTGRTLYELRGAGNDGTVGYSALLPGDLLFGGRDEWVVGAPGSGHNGYQSGRIYILTTDP